MKQVAVGTVTVAGAGGREWDEIVEVFERDLEDTDGSTIPPEDVARRLAHMQAGEAVDIVAVDVS